MGGLIYWFFLLPMALCQSMNESTTHGATSTTREVTGVYAALHLNNYTAVNTVTHNSIATRLTAHCTELWCTTYTTLKVYTQELRLVRKVTLDVVVGAEKVIPLSSLAMMLADHGGLHVLYTNGSRLQTLHTGIFMDVVLVQGGVYALRDWYPTRQNSTLYIYSITSGGLQQSRTITLPHAAERMSFFNETLYLTDFSGNRLYQYRTSGQLLGQHGRMGAVRGSSQPGLLSGPFLCSNDQQGNVLVADSWNHRMQVWSPSNNRWMVTHLARDSWDPRDAVVSEDASTIWVLDKTPTWPNYKHRIVKYTKQ